MKRQLVKICVVAFVATMASCGAKKAIVNTAPKPAPTPAPVQQQAAPARKLAFVQSVSDRQLYQKNIVGSLSFSLKAGSKDISVPGSLHMRKDEVIRLQLFIPLLGSEVGRLEFTPSYVLVIDRIHKEYVKAAYNQLDFLRENGLDFYSLQALFWNQLLLPGTQKVSETDLNRFEANLETAGTTVPVTYRNGKMTFQWNASRQDSKIESAIVNYQSATHGMSQLVWKYANFKPVGVKYFPAWQQFSFTTSAVQSRKNATVTLDMDKLTTDSDWETLTTVSDRYKQVDAREALDKLLKM